MGAIATGMYADRATDPLGVIDIGSNSGRLTVLRLEPSGHLGVVGDARRSLRLVRDLGTGPVLREKTMLQALEAVRCFQAVALGAGATRCLAVATSAVREALNGRELIDRILDETGLSVEVLDGPREAAMAFLGGVHGLPVEHGIVADLGGGSLQLAQFRDRHLVRSWSLPLGCAPLERSFPQKRSTGRRRAAATAKARSSHAHAGARAATES